MDDIIARAQRAEAIVGDVPWMRLVDDASAFLLQGQTTRFAKARLREGIKQRILEALEDSIDATVDHIMVAAAEVAEAKEA